MVLGAPYRKYSRERSVAECGSLADIWRLELRPLAGKGASLPTANRAAQPCRCKHSGQPACSLGPEIEENSAEAPELEPVVQYCIKPFARCRGHRASSWPSCGSFGHKLGTTAPTHLGMPLHRCQTVGSPVAPPEAPQPKTLSPPRRAPELYSVWAAMAASAAGRCAARRRCARVALAGYSRGTPGGTPAESGQCRRRWCASAIGVPISHRACALNVLTRMPYTRYPSSAIRRPSVIRALAP
jgi:hypothetical protein